MSNETLFDSVVTKEYKKTPIWVDRMNVEKLIHINRLYVAEMYDER